MGYLYYLPLLIVIQAGILFPSESGGRLPPRYLLEPIMDIAADESGQIPVVMFHKFVREFEKGDPAITCTLEMFEQLLTQLYDEGYRPISMAEYLSGRIHLQRGYTPVLLTFDDGSSGQFSLVEENGQLATNPETAVYVMEQFHQEHPDFPLKGVFYVNLGWSGTFHGAGELSERLTILTEKGFEVHNHTMDHVYLNKITTATELKRQMGGNQKMLIDAVPGQRMRTLALPFGSKVSSQEIAQYTIKGEYEDVSYEHEAVFLVGSMPADMPYIVGHDKMNTPRIRAEGVLHEPYDFRWWLENRKRDTLYVSDGLPNVVTVPAMHRDKIDNQRIAELGLHLYVDGVQSEEMAAQME